MNEEMSEREREMRVLVLWQRVESAERSIAAVAASLEGLGYPRPAPPEQHDLTLSPHWLNQ